MQNTLQHTYKETPYYTIPQKTHKKEKNFDQKPKKIEKENNNHAIMERNMFLDVYNKKNGFMDYPTNSNDSISIPKPSFDNIEFTPYNFTDEVSKIKKSINDDRSQFEKEEQERRKLFENNENDKKEFLQKQIQKFETKYNPWEILGLEQYDYNINHIKKAYKKNALKYHPDRGGNKYQEKFQLITQAYIYLLSKAEQENEHEIKTKKIVENSDYIDDINESKENIYISKDKFDIQQFNKIFDQYKIPSSFDKGYGNLMKEPLDNETSDNHVFGNSFNHDIFNAHFDNIKSKKSNAIIQYQEPDALESSSSNSKVSFLGIDNIDDFGSMNNNGLSYSDYKKAHIDETLLIDVNKIKYKQYNSIDQLESDRSNLSYNATIEDKQRYDYLERKRMEEDQLRIQQQRNYDMMLENQYNKLNRKLIIHK